MAISLRQYNRIYNKHLLKLLKDGVIPTFDEVVTSAGQELPNTADQAGPIYKYKPQVANGVFDIGLYNRAVRAISDDLNTLFEELTEIDIVNVQRVLHAELFHNVHSYELSRLNRQLDALLFALQGADDNFFAAFDSFNDTTKLDSDLSTPAIISLDEGCLALPISAKGTLKIDLNHLADLVTADVTLSDPTARVTGNIPGTIFGNIFKDSTFVWGIQVESEVDAPLSISFAFTLKQEEFINRITLVGHGEKAQTAYVSLSVDAQNIKSILDYSDGVLLDNQSKTVSLDFPDTLVEYVYVTLSKDAADSTVTVDGKQKYQYIFGLKNVSIYTTGRSETATYTSKTFDFSEDLDAIGQIAISAEEKLPDNTKVDWSVGILDSDGEQIGNFLPITPQSRLDDFGIPKVVNLQDAIGNSKYFVNSSGTYTNVFNFNSIDFFSIVSLTSEPIFGSAVLYRGQRSWLRDSKGNFNAVSTKDNFAPFSRGPTQNLYTIKQEVATIKTVANNANKRVVLVSHPPLYRDNSGYSLIPPQGVNVDKDTSPSYAILSATLGSGPVAKQKAGVTFAGGDENLGQPNIFYQKKGDVVIQEVVVTAFGNYSVGQVLQEFVDGRDFIVDLSTDGSPTGKILLTTGSPLAATPVFTPNTQYVIKYTINPDVTRYISSITNNQIFFEIAATNVNVMTNESIIVRYRYVPKDIIKSSIKVKGSFGVAGEAVIFRQGFDYIFDTTTSTIQKLTTGQITGDVYVDFKFNENTSQVHQFFVWAFVSDPAGIEIKPQSVGLGSLDNQNTLNADTQAGEQFSANIPGIGLVELTNATQWPKMKGWVQFIVKSIPPENLASTSQVALIDQIITLKDRQASYIFVQGGKYFTNLTAFREPMTQVSLPFLKTNVLKNDHRFFAVREVLSTSDPVYQVVVNFEPNTTDELYAKSIDTVNGTVAAHSEEWRIDWRSIESQDSYRKLIVRAVLTRSKSVDGNVTPKVYNYYLKVSP
jgi:hypothetical protein